MNIEKNAVGGSKFREIKIELVFRPFIFRYGAIFCIRIYKIHTIIKFISASSFAVSLATLISFCLTFDHCRHIFSYLYIALYGVFNEISIQHST